MGGVEVFYGGEKHMYTVLMPLRHEGTKEHQVFLLSVALIGLLALWQNIFSLCHIVSLWQKQFFL